MRFFVLLTTISLVILASGLAPRPLSKPNWETPFELALMQNDCSEISRIFEMLVLVSSVEYQFKALSKLYAVGECGYAKDAAQARSYEFAAISASATFLDRVRNESHFGHYLNRLLATGYRGGNGEFRLAFNAFKDAFFRCEKLYPHWDVDSRPNYRMLSFFLSKPAMDVAAMRQHGVEQVSFCTRTVFSALELMLSTASSTEDFVFALNYVRYSFYYEGSAPESAKYLWSSIDKIRPAVIDAFWAQSNLLREEDQILGLDLSGIGCDHVERTGLDGALKCAIATEVEIEHDPRAAMIALYYVARARRLGWVDVTEIERVARGRLTTACLDAALSAEKNDAHPQGDQRLSGFADFASIKDAADCANFDSGER